MNVIEWLLDSDPAIRWQVMREVEPCINGQAVAIGAYFGQDVRGIADRLLTEQMDDGGWNCEQENGSTRGSFDSTLNVLEGLLEYERATGANGNVSAARRRGEEYLLERRLLHRLSDGEIPLKRWLYIGFPNGWFYDIVRALDYLRQADRRPTSGQPRPSASSSRSATRTVAGRSTTHTTTSCSWAPVRRRASRADGSR